MLANRRGTCMNWSSSKTYDEWEWKAYIEWYMSGERGVMFFGKIMASSWWIHVGFVGRVFCKVSAWMIISFNHYRILRIYLAYRTVYMQCTHIQYKDVIANLSHPRKRSQNEEKKRFFSTKHFQSCYCQGLVTGARTSILWLTGRISGTSRITPLQEIQICLQLVFAHKHHWHCINILLKWSNP